MSQIGSNRSAFWGGAGRASTVQARHTWRGTWIDGKFAQSLTRPAYRFFPRCAGQGSPFGGTGCHSIHSTFPLPSRIHKQISRYKAPSKTRNVDRQRGPACLSVLTQSLSQPIPTALLASVTVAATVVTNPPPPPAHRGNWAASQKISHWAGRGLEGRGIGGKEKTKEA